MFQKGCSIISETACDMQRVLVVDDDPMVRRLFKTIINLDMPNMKVDVAVNGADGIDAFERGRHGVITMDLRMPVMDGMSAFRQIGELCTGNHWIMPSVIFCTGYAPPSGIDGILGQSRSHQLLHKPVTAELLVETIQSKLST